MLWFRNLRAFTKLVLSFGLISLLNALAGSFALIQLNNANARLQTAYSRDLAAISQVDNVTAAKLSMARLTRDALIFIQDKKRVADDVKSFDSLAKATQKDLDGLVVNFQGEAGSAEIAETARLFPGYITMCRRILDFAQNGDQTQGIAALDDVQPVAKVLNADSASASAAKRHRAEIISAQSEDSYHSTRAFLLTIILLCISAGVAMSVWIGRLISRPLGETVEILKMVAHGDLTANLTTDTEDETGKMARHLNEALASLRATLASVSEAASTVNVASRELSQASEAIADGAQKQAASLEQTSASLEQITATVRQTANQANSATTVVSASGASAEEGRRVVNEAVAAMGEVNAASARIASIIASIDEISFQTNLLAVNAAVEAARAGEQGRGFAVVAGEIRTLAVRSAAAAREIRQLISNTTGKITRGTELVNDSGERLQQIVVSVKQVCGIVNDMSVACSEQSVGVEQVNLAMSQMDQVTQSNSAQTEELASTAESLAEQAAHLIELVGRFRIDTTGSSGPPKSISAPAQAATSRGLKLRPMPG